MDLDFSADQEALRDAVRAVLEREAPLSLARGISEGTATSDKLWATMVDLGWPALCVSEAHGGIGLGAIELGLLAEELGRCVAGTPLLATISQFGMFVAACGDAQQQAHWLSRVADGSCIGTIGIA